jgi:hypothetical protein
MKREPPFQKHVIPLNHLRDKAFRELLPRMVEDIMSTDKKDLKQYRYLLQCHLENWINTVFN